MKRSRQRFFDHYEKIQIPADNRKGYKIQLRYKSDWYAWDLTESELRREKLLFAGACIAGLALFLISATRFTEFNEARISSGFSVVSVIPFLAECWGVIRFLLIKQPMMIPDFEEIRSCIQIGSIVHAILLGGTVVSGMIHLILLGRVDAANLLTALGHLLSALLSVFIFLRYNKLNYHTVVNPNGK